MSWTLEQQNRSEAEEAYKVLLYYEKELKLLKRNAREESEGEKSKYRRSLSWPVTLLYISKNLIEEAEKIVYWRERNAADLQYAPELITEMESDRSNQEQARNRIKDIFTDKLEEARKRLEKIYADRHAAEK